MTILEIVLIGISLAMDAFAVSLATSMVSKMKDKKIYSMPLLFALFQMIMPCIGFFASGLFEDIISKYANIAVFAILIMIGIGMIKEGITHMNNPHSQIKEISFVFIFMQGFATSIDAFAVGVGFRATQVNLIGSVLVIGVITFILCSIAIMIGKKAGKGLGGKAEILGGVILCIIAIKSLGI